MKQRAAADMQVFEKEPLEMVRAVRTTGQVIDVDQDAKDCKRGKATRVRSEQKKQSGSHAVVLLAVRYLPFMGSGARD